MGMLLLALATIGCDPPDDAADAGMDAPFTGDTGDAPHETVIVRGSCTYVDYGSTCHVDCDRAEDVPIQLIIEWSEPYCCGFPTRSHEPFYDCRCIEGEVRCTRFDPGEYDTPRSTCEGCPGTESGMAMNPPRDAALPVAESDAGT